MKYYRSRHRRSDRSGCRRRYLRSRQPSSFEDRTRRQQVRLQEPLGCALAEGPAIYGFLIAILLIFMRLEAADGASSNINANAVSGLFTC